MSPALSPQRALARKLFKGLKPPKRSFKKTGYTQPQSQPVETSSQPQSQSKSGRKINKPKKFDDYHLTQ